MPGSIHCLATPAAPGLDFGAVAAVSDNPFFVKPFHKVIVPRHMARVYAFFVLRKGESR